ncbi:MAG TPA: cobalamin-dependent protein [Pilimelia sp.]|nr:cobalamin-dependent protein [Pilimelia sp.]
MRAIGDDERRTLLHHLRAPDDTAAVDLVRRLRVAGVPPEQLLVDLIAPVQVCVGELWQRNRMSVVSEHLASGISERLVATALADAPLPPHRGDVLMACAEGEWHALAARLVADVLRLRGWRVRFLGAAVPAAQLAPCGAELRPRAALVSATMASRLPQVTHAVGRCRRVGLPTMVGGAAFRSDGALGRRVGADAWAPDGAVAAGLLEHWPPPPAPDPVVPVDEEYPLLSRERWRLIDDAMRLLTRGYAPLRGFSPGRLDSTIAELDHLLDFLASAVFLDDEAVFVDFARWLGETLDAHDEPVELVETVLTGLADLLGDRPRTRRILLAGRAALGERTVAHA